jgi:hypothetical protein
MRRLPLLLALALMSVPAHAADKPADRSLRQCWRSNDFDGFTATSDHAFNMRTRDGRYWHVETTSCPNLQSAQPRLVTQVRGSDLICGPVDWDLRVANGSGPGGFAEPCIVQSQRLLSREEAAALPRREKP